MANENQVVTSSGEAGASTSSASDLGDKAAPEVTTEEQGASERQTTPERNPLDDWGTRAADEQSGKEADKAPEADKAAKETPEVKDGEKAAEKPAKSPERGTKDDEDEILDELFAEDGKEKAPKDEKEVDLDKLDPEEQIAAQRNKTARSWAERRDKLANHVDAFRFDSKPIEDFVSGLKDLNPERFEQFRQIAAHSLVDENPEATFQRALVMHKRTIDPKYDYTKDTLPTLEQIAKGEGVQTGTSTPAIDEKAVKSLTKAVDDVVDWDWRDPKNDDNFLDDRELAMVKTIRALSEKVTSGATGGANPEDATKVTELETKLAEATKELDSLKGTVLTKEQEALQNDIVAEVGTFRTRLESKLLPAIYQNTGINVSEKDTPEVAALKKNLQTKYEGTEYEKQHGSATQFETYAYYESEQKDKLEANSEEIATEIRNLVTARKAKDTAKAEKAESALKTLRVDLMTLLAQASKGFKEKEILPYLSMLGKGQEKAVKHIEEAAERVEIVDGGGSAKPGKKPVYETADDVWGGMVSESSRDETLRSGAAVS